MTLLRSWTTLKQAALSRITRLFFVKQPTITKGIIFAVFLSVFSLFCLAYYVSNLNVHTIRRAPPEPTVKCRFDSLARLSPSPVNDHTSAASLRSDNKVLVLMETLYTKQGQGIVSLLEANRIAYKLDLAGKSLPYLTHKDKGKFGVVVFEKLESYLNMDKWNKQLLDKYCVEYKVGILTFASPSEALINAQVVGFPLFVHTKLSLEDYHVNPGSSILRLTRAGEVAYGPLPGDDWTVFSPNHTTYVPLSYSKLRSSEPDGRARDDISYITAIQDTGLYDGIQRVIFGNNFKFWLHRLLFLDALSYLSHGKFSSSLYRYVLIDIDDIFVGRWGTRMTPYDVKALRASQSRLREYIPGFTFNLGFSGKFFHQGTAEENRGDDHLIEHKDDFWWFPHMWRHLQPHKFDNVSHLQREMMKNVYFAQAYGIPVNSSYAVAPHHSGVFPIHEPLYAAWKTVWDIQVTSTEEYPHLRPAWQRRGFIHRDIKVLPRHTCGLFTHTIFLDKYPGGRERLESSIAGGELFQTFVNNPISIFMTHLSNYGNDRLALYTFESVVKFIKCWTNLKLVTIPPVELAEKYFTMFPEEQDPVWRNPCDDKRHLAIWSASKRCDSLPDFLVVGPQKTGTTALYSFLMMNPNIVSSYQNPNTFEEVQFFNNKNYYKGLDWYLDFFPAHSNRSSHMLFEKSANYFDSDMAAERAHALLPRAKIICILINPAKRAYSWYQHVRAHGDERANNYSFYEVVTADDDSPKAVRELKHRCLNPGFYAQHLENWLDYYSPKQILILDGEQLKTDPVSVMEKVQVFLQVDPLFDYSRKLKFNPKKGFFCQVVGGDHTKCLGRSKGRIYPPMSKKAEKFLKANYRRHNIQLSKLLGKLGHPVPPWLEEELSELT